MILTIIILAGLIIWISVIIFIIGCSNSAATFQIPCDAPQTNPNDLAADDRPKMSPWDYYISLKHKSWDELSEYEKNRMIIAAHLILDDCGTNSTYSEIEEFLKINLPEKSDQRFGGDSALVGFREWQE